MEMIDVLKKLQEIAETKPELVADAVDNVQRTNPKDAVNEGGMKDYLHSEAEKLSRKEFLEKHGSSLAGFYDAINGDPEDNEEPMEGKKDMKKETVNEAIQISTDSPEEASMMMQILKLAGVQPVDAKMIGADEPKDEPEMNPDDAAGSMDMARMRDIVKKPEDDQKEETFANEPEEKVSDVDTLVNVNSGGLNRQKKSYPKVAGGDSPMAYAEDKITEEELANSLRTQYENFKEAYQAEAKKAKPDFLDMDKDGNKKEPMKKAIKDKEAK
jgi:DNA-binding transcriptional MerR regulator